MLKQITIVFWILGLSYNLFAQTDQQDILADEEVQFIQQLDSMSNWLYSGFITQNMKDSSIATLPKDSFLYLLNDSLIVNDLRQTASPIDLAFNRYVKRYIEVYGLERRHQVERMLGVANWYFPVFETALDRKDMPVELKYLPIVESALNAEAVSFAGASGLWQIMYYTGKSLGLTINSYVDERRDPVKSTEAALDYLDRLYKVYDDWLLVIAAYNCGPGNVNKAIRRSGGHKNFWSIRKYLPRETRGYVPAFLGAMYVMENHEKFGLKAINPEFEYFGTDTVLLTQQFDLKIIADSLDMEFNTLAALNPALKKYLLPINTDGYPLTLPINKIGLFESKKAAIIAAQNTGEDQITESIALLEKSEYPYKDENLARLVYKVKPGDNLGYIAEWYDCKASEIRNWNDIYGNIIRVGQRLDIFVQKDKVGNYADIDALSFNEKQAQTGASSARKTYETDENCQCVYHEVKQGDTLWDISRLYPNVSIDKLKEWNELNDSRQLKPGMKLKIRT